MENKNNNGGDIKQIPSKPSEKKKEQPEKTLLESFRDAQKRFTKENYIEEIVGFIAKNDARAMCLYTGLKDNSIMYQALDFYLHFCAEYGDDEDLLGVIKENWPMNPYLFKVATGNPDETIEFYAAPVFVSKNTLTLVDYIFKIHEHRVIDFISDEEDEGEDAYVAELPKVIPEEDREMTKWLIQSISLATVTSVGGGVILHHGEDSTFTVEGFYTSQGNISVITKKELIALHKLMPPDAFPPNIRFTYKTPSMIFLQGKAD